MPAPQRGDRRLCRGLVEEWDVFAVARDDRVGVGRRYPSGDAGPAAAPAGRRSCADRAHR